LKIVTWNVNSLNQRADFVAMYLDSDEPDILCLQELKLETDAVPIEIFTERGYEVAVHGQKAWNGVLIASKFPITDVHRGLDADEGESRLIAVTTAGLRIVNLYCPQGQREDSPKFPYKLAFYDGLIEWLEQSGATEKPLIVLGDLNIAPEPRDVWDPTKFVNVPTFHPKEHERWARLLELGLEDVVKPYVEPGNFSFWDYRGGAFRFNHGMRIDHILLNAPLRDRVTNGWINRQQRKKKEGLTASDHAPVGIELAPAD
jgi:exodeoxyribonuclease-3